MKKESANIIIITIVSCLIMAVIDTVIEPPYAVKSAAKLVLFLLIPLLFMRKMKINVFNSSFAVNKRDMIKLLSLGASIYLAVILTYILTKNAVDYSALVASLSADHKVSGRYFIWVALYISFCNSFLEEFQFRVLSFIKLSEYMKKSIAYIFSSVMFAVYHIAMIGASFPFPLLMLALFGLAVGGYIFDRADDKSKNLYNSWIIHMFADFAIMTIWYIHI